jgi:Arc/MetJ-type ribon-helix-helix transcriptional regulator
MSTPDQTITVSKETADWINERVHSGAARSADDVINALLRLASEPATPIQKPDPTLAMIGNETADWITTKVNDGTYHDADTAIFALLDTLEVTATYVPKRLAHRIRLLLDDLGRTRQPSGILYAEAANLATLLTRCHGYPTSVWSDDPVATGDDFEDRLDRLTKAVVSMADWLVQAQTGFGKQDADAIIKIVKGEHV